MVVILHINIINLLLICFLADLQNQIRELKPLQTRVLLVTEECNRKVLARWEDGQAQVRALEEDKRQLLKDMEDMREQEERQNAVVWMQFTRFILYHYQSGVTSSCFVDVFIVYGNSHEIVIVLFRPHICSVIRIHLGNSLQ